MSRCDKLPHSPREALRLGSLFLLAALGASLLLPSALRARPKEEPPAVRVIASEELRADLEILEQALFDLHPGLDRYGGRAAIEEALKRLKETALSAMTMAETYLALSRFLATIQCGHTYANFWNQPEEIQVQLFGQDDKVPFVFRLVAGRMIVESSAADSPKLRRGVEILALGGVEVGAILRRLLPLLSADGGNDGQRFHLREPRSESERWGAGSMT